MPLSKIWLTPQEQKLKNLLLAVAKYVDESNENSDSVILRFAGGWVRDKLLGVQSNDIDTSINNMTGVAFSTKIKNYVEIDGKLEKHDMEATDLGNLHTIKKNPEKSKNLETATIRLFGLDVDFVNLRKETYKDDSRTPDVEFGTPQEDAERRDASINALFYNIHTDAVEDFTGGLEDLNNALMKTPMDPVITFIDDPLRVLRLIRFVTRLDFRLDEGAAAAMKRKDIRDALRLKISRERIGQELEKMLKGTHPQKALAMIDQLGLYEIIFTDPTIQGVPAPVTEKWHLSYNCLDQIQSNLTPGSIHSILVRSAEARYISWTLACLVPWFGVPTAEPGQAGSKSLSCWATRVAREGIKLPTQICSVVTGAFRHLGEIQHMRESLKNKTAVIDRGVMGMMIRKWDAAGGHWRVQLLMTILLEALKLDESAGFQSLITEWQEFLDHLESMELLDAPSIKPPLDGKFLSAALDMKPGPWLKAALDKCMEWKLRHPEVQDIEKVKEGAIEEVKSKRSELKIPRT